MATSCTTGDDERTLVDDDDDVCYYIGERLKLEGETENNGVSAKRGKGGFRKHDDDV